jgi:hypothetical protein
LPIPYRRRVVTVLAFSEQIEKCVSASADELQSEKSHQKVTLTAVVGKQTFVITVQEMAKDHDEPAIS